MFRAIFGNSPSQSSSLVKKKVLKKMSKSIKIGEPSRYSRRKKPEVNYRELEDCSKKPKTGKNIASSHKLDIIDLGVKSDEKPDAIIENSLFLCSECSSAFKFKNSLVKHIKAIHNKLEFKCDVCEKSYNYKTNLRRHISVAHGESSVKYQCGQCNKFYLYSCTLKKHIRKNHM